MIAGLMQTVTELAIASVVLRALVVGACRFLSRRER